MTSLLVLLPKTNVGRHTLTMLAYTPWNIANTRRLYTHTHTKQVSIYKMSFTHLHEAGLCQYCRSSHPQGVYRPSVCQYTHKVVVVGGNVLLHVHSAGHFIGGSRLGAVHFLPLLLCCNGNHVIQQ